MCSGTFDRLPDPAGRVPPQGLVGHLVEVAAEPSSQALQSVWRKTPAPRSSRHSPCIPPFLSLD